MMDERHLLAAARYVERNPVRARLCARPQEWPWSSAVAHLAGGDDALVTVRPLLELVPGWEAFIGGADDERLDERLTRSRQYRLVTGFGCLRRLPGATPRPRPEAEETGAQDTSAGSRYGRPVRRGGTELSTSI